MKKPSFKINLSVFFALAFIVTFFAVRNLTKVDKKSYCPLPPLRVENQYGRIESVRPFQIVYSLLHSFDSGGEKDLVLVDHPPETQNPAPQHLQLRYVQNLGRGQFKEMIDFPTIRTGHTRHPVPIQLDSGVGFVLTDHGNSSAAGGTPHIVLRREGVWKDETARLFPPLKENFNIRAATFNLMKNGKTDLFFSVITGDNNHSYVLRNNGRDHFTLLQNLPEDIRREENCYMNVHSVDLNGDGQKELYLGRCYRDPTHPSDRDRILYVKNGQLELSPLESLPLPATNPNWGVGSITSADLNQDGFVDIITANHNEDYTDGQIQIYLNSGQDWQFRQAAHSLVPIEKDKTSFVTSLTTGNFDEDSFPEIAMPIIGLYENGDPHLKRSFALYKNIDGENFMDITSCIHTPLKYIVATEFADIDHDGKQDLFLLNSDGEFHIIYNRH